MTRPAPAPVLDSGCRTDLATLDGQPLPIRVFGDTGTASQHGALQLEACGAAPIHLSAGQHILRATPGAGSGLDIDAIALGSGAGGAATAPSPGAPPTGLDVAAATETEGTATIEGSVIGQDRDPIAGALVTLLLKSSDLPGGEEHYRVAVTDASGAFTLPNAPAGQFLLKAYAPNTIYVSRIVALDEGETEKIQFGLPERVVENPTISRPKVQGPSISVRAGAFAGVSAGAGAETGVGTTAFPA